MLLAKCFVQHIIHFVHTEFLLELADGGVFVDVYHFDTGDFGVVFPILGCQVV